jgi:hypothetical protein
VNLLGDIILVVLPKPLQIVQCDFGVAAFYVCIMSIYQWPLCDPEAGKGEIVIRMEMDAAT